MIWLVENKDISNSNWINQINKFIPYYKTIGMRLKELGNGQAKFELDVRKELTQSVSVHGGVFASMIDSACACATMSNDPTTFASTINLQVSYLKPVTKGTLTCRAEVVKNGRNISFCEAKVWNDKSELVATGMSQIMKVKIKRKFF